MSQIAVSVVRWSAATASVLLLAGTCGGPGGQGSGPVGGASSAATPSAAMPAPDAPIPAAPPTAVVVNIDGYATPIDVATNKAGKQYRVGAQPIAAAVTLDNATAYVTNSKDGTVTAGSLATRLTTTIKVGRGPTWVAFTPDGATALVTNGDDGTVSPITVATGAVGDPIDVGPQPAVVALTPDGTTAYVTDGDDGTLTPITVATLKPGTPIKVGSKAAGVAITPDGATAYVANPDKNVVVPVTLATGQSGTPIPVGQEPSVVAITPDGATAFVSNFGESSVTPIAVATNTAEPPITVGKAPAGVAVTLDGATAYVANSGDGTVTPIEVATKTAGAVIKVGGRPSGIGLPIPGSPARAASPSAPAPSPTTSSSESTPPSPTCGDVVAPTAPLAALIPTSFNWAPLDYSPANGQLAYDKWSPELTKVLGTTYGSEVRSGEYRGVPLPRMKAIAATGVDEYYLPKWNVVYDKSAPAPDRLPAPYAAGQLDVTAATADLSAPGVSAMPGLATADGKTEVKVWKNDQKADPCRSPMLGELGLFTGDIPPGWVEAKGQIRPIAREQALFTLIGTIYGGNGRTDFALPDMPEKVDGARWAIAVEGNFPTRN